MSMHSPSFIARLAVAAVGVSFTLGAFAPSAQAAELEYSGWVPYWAAKKGAADARRHIDDLEEVNPFVFTIKADGTLKDNGKMKASHWKSLIKSAKKEDVRVIPTVMTSDGALVHRLLSNPAARAAHIEEIVDMVEDGKYDGVDIDYEGKLAETNPYFSLFLAELKDELGRKHLSCSIEARMPVADRYAGTPPASAYQFANDLPAIGRACDTVRAMTYDQQTADQKLNAANTRAPYFPVADTAWVRKVANTMLKDIPKDKLVLGVATYGRELIATVSPEGKFTYVNDGAFNPKYAQDIAKKYKVKASENSAGEMSLTYVAKKRSDPTQKELIAMAPSGTLSGERVALGAKEYAKEEGVPVSFHFLSWSGADAIADKAALAKELGLRGIAVFKLDAAYDKDLWDALQ